MDLITVFLNNLNLNWSITETIAVIFSVIYVILAAKKNILCWFFAAISVILYIYICWNAKLYAESSLQIFYLFMAGYGYYNWKRSDNSFTVRFCWILASLTNFAISIYLSTNSGLKSLFFFDFFLDKKRFFKIFIQYSLAN